MKNNPHAQFAQNNQVLSQAQAQANLQGLSSLGQLHWYSYNTLQSYGGITREPAETSDEELMRGYLNYKQYAQEQRDKLVKRHPGLDGLSEEEFSAWCGLNR